MSDLQHTSLHDRHVALGAKLGDFGGWEMPIEYPGGGVLAEHSAVRERVGVFDVGHLGKAVVRGAGAADFVNAALTNDLRKIGPMQAQYTLCCDEETGGVVDDLIAYLRDDDEVYLIPNAANTSGVVARLAAGAPAGISVDNLHTALGVIAVQGPRSAELLGSLGLPAPEAYMSWAAGEWRGLHLMVARSGYTGELGFELVPRAENAGELWDAVLAAGTAYDALPCGLGARDTLRTEMGYPLHGHELSLEITPNQARAGWAVGWDKPAFWGRDVLLAEKESGAARLLWGLESQDRGIPRQGMTVTRGGLSVGTVTSGTFSPTRKQGIGLALLARGVVVGDLVAVDVRGRESTMKVVKPPFVDPHVRG
ncbi:MAG TPA: glycine cleavage system aminomethyltransferase GcvT [Mycobacteriales bacterium]|nr:glycine cleavage system aminomethyltransferase GcvT [Mycobacteriales bacterium]